MTWSLSKLKTYEQCPRKFQYRYIQRLEEKTKSQAATRGTNNHKIIEEFILGNTKVLPEDLNFYQPWLSSLKETDAYPEHKVALTTEWKVTGWEDPDADLRSILDLKVVQPDRIHVYDWKTGKIYPDHDDQKELYALTAFAEHPNVNVVISTHVYLDLNKNREKTYHRDEVPSTQKRWERRVRKMYAEEEFIPVPQFFCRYCPYSKAQGGPCQF